MDGRTLSKVPGRFQMVDERKTCADEVSFYFQFELNKLWVFLVCQQ